MNKLEEVLIRKHLADQSQPKGGKSNLLCDMIIDAAGCCLFFNISGYTADDCNIKGYIGGGERERE